VGLPLVYRRADLHLRYRISLVDMVMGEHSSPVTSGRASPRLGAARDAEQRLPEAGCHQPPYSLRLVS
jgi:hypothetical protein